MIILINPNVSVQKNDVFTTGIIYMPVGLAFLAGTLKAKGFKCAVIDAFGEDPSRISEYSGFFFRGLLPDETVSKIPANVSEIIIYAGNLMSHFSTIAIVKACRKKFPSVPLIALENTQSVTSYSLRNLKEKFLEAGADYVVTGESENRLPKLMAHIAGKSALPDGVACVENCGIKYSPPAETVKNLDSLPFPAWEMFPLENYWKLKYSHAPLENGKYLPLLTSRGCPYACKFCISPEMNSSEWRKRSAENLVSEMEHWIKTFGVREFHIEDLNPTVDENRIIEFCEKITEKNLKVKWKIASGTKAETIKNPETLKKMARAGCSYISFSQESGSEKVLQSMNKNVDSKHILNLLKHAHKAGIFSQICYVLGFPGETEEDRNLTEKSVSECVKAGADEIAVFIITPAPGSDIYNNKMNFLNLTELSFSPAWRQDYKKLNSFRLKLYIKFLLLKTARRPFAVAAQCLRFALRRFKTKMEMTPYRALHTMLISFKTEKRRFYEN